MQVESWRADGDLVHAERYSPGKGKVKGGLLLVHGYNSNLREFGDTPARFAAQGFHVMALDLPGHGQSQGPRTLLRFPTVRATIDEASRRLRAATRKPLAILGHSMGGAWAADALQRNESGLWSAGILAHPVNKPLSLTHPLELAAYRALVALDRRRTARGKQHIVIPYRTGYPKLFVDKQAEALARAEGFLAGTTSAGNYDALSQLHVEETATRVTVPTLVVTSENDQVVPARHSRDVFTALAGPKRLVEHSGGHSCFRDMDRENVIQSITGFLEDHL